MKFDNRKFKSPDDLAAAVDRYLDDCASSNKVPTYPGLLLALNISADTYNNYMSNKDGLYDGYAEALKKAETVFQTTLIDLGLSDNKKSVFCMFLLKQRFNGGYSDQKQEDGPKEITVKINNAGDTPFA